MYAAHSGLYTLAGRPVTQIVFTYLAYIHRCRAYRYTTLLHRCRRVILERFFFSNSSPPLPTYRFTSESLHWYNHDGNRGYSQVVVFRFRLHLHIRQYNTNCVHTSTCYNIFDILLRITRCPAVHERRRNKFIIIYVLRSHNTRVGLACIRW